jgi:hypothetical protein
MLTRLWFAVSLGWAVLFFYNDSTRTVPSVNGADVMIALFPFLVGVIIRNAWRYIRTGSLRSRV